MVKSQVHAMEMKGGCASTAHQVQGVPFGMRWALYMLLNFEAVEQWWEINSKGTPASVHMDGKIHKYDSSLGMSNIPKLLIFLSTTAVYLKRVMEQCSVISILAELAAQQCRWYNVLLDKQVLLDKHV